MTPERLERIESVIAKKQPSITILMENIHDPHNIAAVMRTADAIGLIEIYVLNTKLAKHKKFGDKSSSSANKWLNVHQFEDLQLCMNTIKGKYENIYATYLHQESKSLYELNLANSVCLVFGNEKDGVSEDLLKYCTGNFIIPQVGMIKSLNISVACAVSLYEAFRQRNEAGMYKQPQLNNEAYENMLADWKQRGDSSAQ